MCGGSPVCAPNRSPGCGLSPRVRGKLPPAALADLPPGSIPACAGEALLHCGHDYTRWVYPRVCGGSRPGTAPRGPPVGLSPRVRGKHSCGEGQDHVHRSIPACAGEAPTLEAASAMDESIPACAGEAITNPTAWASGTVYPRVCGGSAGARQDCPSGEGLSPRVRGKPDRRFEWWAIDGSIPACAGEAASDSIFSMRFRVYPRVCGGSLPASGDVWGGGGLSPRVRGKRDAGAHVNAERRSIPACAGEAHCWGRGARGRKVYPRVCGGSASPRRLQRAV